MSYLITSGSPIEYLSKQKSVIRYFLKRVDELNYNFQLIDNQIAFSSQYGQSFSHTIGTLNFIQSISQDTEKKTDTMQHTSINHKLKRRFYCSCKDINVGKAAHKSIHCVAAYDDSLGTVKRIDSLCQQDGIYVRCCRL